MSGCHKINNMYHVIASTSFYKDSPLSCFYYYSNMNNSLEEKKNSLGD